MVAIPVKYEKQESSHGPWHCWSAKDERGGVHIWARITAGFANYGPEWIGGCEHHSPVRREYDSEQPSHDDCWLLGGPCWHDGSSLMFSEQIAPMLPPAFLDNPHDMTRAHSSLEFKVRDLFRSWVGEYSPTPTGSKETGE